LVRTLFSQDPGVVLNPDDEKTHHTHQDEKGHGHKEQLSIGLEQLHPEPGVRELNYGHFDMVAG
jgi:hypothetical protein